MGNFAGMCGGTVSKKSTKEKTNQKGKKEGQIDFNVGFSTLQDNEFKEATRKFKQQQQDLLKQDLELQKMEADRLEMELENEIKGMLESHNTMRVNATIQARKNQDPSMVTAEAMLLASTQQQATRSRRLKRKKHVKTQHDIEMEAKQHRQYDTNFLENDDLLDRMMSFRTKVLMQEKKCEPSPFFQLKNSDELLWEDQTEYLNNVVLSEFTELNEFKDHLEVEWEGYDIMSALKRYQIVINTLRMSNYTDLHNYENEFFYNKKQQHRLLLLRQDSIAQEFYHYIYYQQLFRIQYGFVYLNVRESRSMTLHRLIKIRAETDNYYKDAEVLSMMVHLLRAVRDASGINVTHGGIHDENVFVGWGGRYHLGDFGIVRLKTRKAQEQQPTNTFNRAVVFNEELGQSEANSFAEDNDQNEDQMKKRQLIELLDQVQKQYTLSYQFHRYHAYKYKPRHQIFWCEELLPLFTSCMKSYYLNKYQSVKDLHDSELYKYTGTEEENKIQQMLHNQDVYSVGIIALQMMTLGSYETEHCKLKEDQTKSRYGMSNKASRGDTYMQVQLSLSKSMYGQPSKMQSENAELRENQNNQNCQLMDSYARRPWAEMEVMLNGLIYRYPIAVTFLKKMLRPDPRDRVELKTLVSGLMEEEFESAQDEAIFQDYAKENPHAFTTHFDEIITHEKTKFNGLILKAFDKEHTFVNVRKMYYKSLGYMLIRNYRMCQSLIERMHSGLAKERVEQNVNKMRYYNIKQISDLYLSNFEDVLLQLMKGICQIESRQLESALETLVDVEGSLLTAEPETLRLINPQVPKFYQGVASYYSGEPENALVLFNRVQEMSKGQLKSQNIDAYYQFTKINILLQLDSDGYFEAFKMLEELIEQQDIIQAKYEYITIDLVIGHYMTGKAYFEVNQFQLSKVCFLTAFDCLRQQANISNELIGLRLKILGYLSYLFYLQADMEAMQVSLTESVSVLNALLKRENYLETVIIWLNSFGFLLKAYFTSHKDDLHQFIEVFDLIVQKNEKQLNIDLFFKNFVFAKLYYFAGQFKKAQKSFLDTLEMHQYYITDDLRIKQTQNISVKQLKMQQDQKVARLNQISKIQQKGGANLPPPEKDNLTIRLIIEIYDWLGYLYGMHSDFKRATKCYDYYQEFSMNLIKFDKTLSDEYMLRIAKMAFHQKQYHKCLEMLRDLSIDLKKQQIDDFLRFEYQQIQSEIQLWMGNLHLMLREDDKAAEAFTTAKNELFRLKKCSDLLANELEQMTKAVDIKNLFKEEESKLPNKEDETAAEPEPPQLQGPQQSGELKKSSLKKSRPISTIVQAPAPEQNVNVMEQIKMEELKKKAIAYEKNHQIVILLLYIQLQQRISADCLALGLKKRALEYMEELIQVIEQDKFFNSPLFTGYIKQSMKIDIFFYMGYLYGMNEQHENAFVFYDRTYDLLQELYEVNSLDQTNIEHMSLIYDQLGRVCANQGFFKKASRYLHQSLHMLQKVKKDTSDLQLAYKFANIGATDLRLGNFQEADRNMSDAIKLFEVEYGIILNVMQGKISIPVFAARVKLMEIKLHDPNIIELKRTLLKILKDYRFLPNEQHTLRFEGQLSRVTAAYWHRMGVYRSAYEEYTKAFVRMLEDAEVGEHLLSKMKTGDMEDLQYLVVRITDRASLEVVSSIAELYLDTHQYYQAFKLSSTLCIVFQGVPFTPQRLNKLRVLGIEEEIEVPLPKGAGILATIPSLVKQMNDTTQSALNQPTYYQIRGTEIMSLVKNRKSANILCWAEALRVKGHALNNWYSKQREPYLFPNYEEIINHFTILRQGLNQNREQKQAKDEPFQKANKRITKVDLLEKFQLYEDDNPNEKYLILEEQANAKTTIMDALIIYQETIGDYQIGFAESLFQLAERQYFLNESDEVDLYIQKVLNLLKNLSDANPVLVWRALLLQAKVKIAKNRIGKILLFLMGKLYIEEEQQKKIIFLVKQNHTKFMRFCNAWMLDDDLHFPLHVTTFHTLFEDLHKSNFQYTSTIEQPLMIVRDVLEGQSWLKKTEEAIKRTIIKIEKSKRAEDRVLKQVMQSKDSYLHQIQILYDLASLIVGKTEKPSVRENPLFKE